MKHPKILSLNKIRLDSYRNYQNLEIDFASKSAIITGDNGAGKTNILEAISLLSPGKGLRGANLAEISNSALAQEWALKADISGTYGPANITYATSFANGVGERRYLNINGENIRGKAEIAKIFCVIWLTPQMDNIFLSASSERRKFYDRLVYNFDSEHAVRVAKYEYYMKERNRLLQESSWDHSWLKILEEKMSEIGVSILASRLDATNHLNRIIANADTLFPKANIHIKGELEELISSKPAIEVENYFKDKLITNRNLDARTGRTNFGPHRSEIIIYHTLKNQLAELCSTGEQKAMLISIILADVRARVEMTNTVPIILLDEVVAHLDHHRRAALLDELINLKAQFFITGVYPEDFKLLAEKVNFYHIENGKLVS